MHRSKIFMQTNVSSTFHCGLIVPFTYSDQEITLYGPFVKIITEHKTVVHMPKSFELL